MGTIIQKYILLLQEVHKLDITVLAEISLQLLLAICVKVFNVPDVNVSCGSGVDRERKCRRERSRVLTPSDLQSPVVQSQPLVRSDLEERQSGRWINECDKLGRRLNDQYNRLRFSRWQLTAICLSCMYLKLCNTPPRIELQRSSAVVSGWMLPK